MSNKLPVLSGDEVCRALENARFAVIPGRGKGSHRFLYRDTPPTGITVSNQKEIKRGTLRYHPAGWYVGG